jgi:hypothetical protein
MAALTERERGELVHARFALGVHFGRRLPLDYSTLQHSHVPPPQRSSHRTKHSSTDWLPEDALFQPTDRFARNQAASGVNTSRTKQSVRMSQIDGRLALHGRSIVDDALSRYKQEFTASVKLHTSSAKSYVG